jgi:hypothetical protein
MITNIAFVDISALQIQLDTEIGYGIFYVGINESVVPHQCYIEYNDSTPQSQIDQALSISSTLATETLNKTIVRLYQALDITATKQILIVETPQFTTEEINEANLWLQNQSLPIPSCVTYLSLKDNISTQIAAETIVNSTTVYDQKIQQIKNLAKEGQLQVTNGTDTYSVKLVAQNFMDQIKSIT